VGKGFANFTLQSRVKLETPPQKTEDGAAANNEKPAIAKTKRANPRACPCATAIKTANEMDSGQRSATAGPWLALMHRRTAKATAKPWLIKA